MVRNTLVFWKPRWMLQRGFLALVAAVLFPSDVLSGTTSGAAILQELRAFRELGSVLYVAAHPDDENTQLITYLARGRNYRTAYLSLTRGDGGQNLIGPELGEKLGVARTQELLAARRLDGGRQFFTRAVDFGFSKDSRATLNIWDREQVLSDMVRIIRLFRPDVIVTRFSPQPGGTHGHHTASAVLAVEAFRLAADPKAFPEQLRDLKPWQAKRVFHNTWAGGGRGGGGGTDAAVLRLDVDGTDPVLGQTFGEIAARSRAMHVTQGFGNYSARGGSRSEAFVLLAGEPAINDILDGVETTWARFPGGEGITQLIDSAIQNFDIANVSASVPSLLAIRARVAALPTDPVVTDKLEQLDGILRNCLGLRVRTTIPRADIVPGERVQMQHRAELGAAVPVRWLGVRYPAVQRELSKEMNLRPGRAATLDSLQVLPQNAPLTHPYWLRSEGTAGLFRVEDRSLIGRPENPPTFPVEHVFEVGGQKLVIQDEPVQVVRSSDGTEMRHRMQVIAPVSLELVPDVKLIPPGETREIEVRILAARKDLSGTVDLNGPEEWRMKPGAQRFTIPQEGGSAVLKFAVTSPAQPGVGKITAFARMGHATFSVGRSEIRYEHIPPQLLQPTPTLKAVAAEVETRARKIGYLHGAGDDVPAILREMGCEVTVLQESDVTEERLQRFDAVVLGVRAFNTREKLREQLPVLFQYVESGGNVIVQYNRPEGSRTERIAPFELRLSGDRVTDERAPITFLAPDHPVLNMPNKITQADFDGWVQERGLYFAGQWDERFTPVLACNDPGESPKSGGLLIAQHGKGFFVYTGFAFFRQLPEGVPGALRLFANILSLGK